MTAPPLASDWHADKRRQPIKTLGYLYYRQTETGEKNAQKTEVGSAYKSCSHRGTDQLWDSGEEKRGTATGELRRCQTTATSPPPRYITQDRTTQENCWEHLVADVRNLVNRAHLSQPKHTEQSGCTRHLHF